MSNSVQYIQDVNNGQLNSNSVLNKNKSNNNSLGKDAFLKLLVTQLQHQDPLNPSSDTEFIAQLATFSQLEEMQNLSQNSANSQAFTLVGKDVVMKVEDSVGNPVYILGKVDFVTLVNGKAHLSIDDNSYSIDKLYQVIDEEYYSENIDKEDEVEESEEDKEVNT